MDHLGEFIGQQAHLVVVALHAAIEGDVFLDHHREGGGGNGNFDVVHGRVAGGLGEVTQPFEVTQVDVLERVG